LPGQYRLTAHGSSGGIPKQKFKDKQRVFLQRGRGLKPEFVRLNHECTPISGAAFVESLAIPAGRTCRFKWRI
jgi:hypothetical protein